MLSAEDKQRIEEEERYRADIRRELGPIETTSFINKLAKFVVKAFIWCHVLAFIVIIIIAIPKKTDATVRGPLQKKGGVAQSPALKGTNTVGTPATQFVVAK
jgi:hypothetical protein